MTNLLSPDINCAVTRVTSIRHVYDNSSVEQCVIDDWRCLCTMPSIYQVLYTSDMACGERMFVWSFQL